MVRRIVPQAILGLLCCTVLAEAQTPRLTYTMHWMQVYAGTNQPVPVQDGVLQIGEAAHIRVDVSFDPPVGTLVSYQVPSPGGLAPVAGLLGGMFNLQPIGNGAGEWSHISTASGFQALPAAGGAPDGRYIWAGASQPSAPWPWMPDPRNPVTALWEGVWTPTTYEPRYVDFTMLQPFSRIYIDRGPDPLTGHPIYSHLDIGVQLDTVRIPIVIPNGSTTAALAIAAILLPRRRRPGRQ